MKEAKQLFLYLALGALFIVLVGMYSNSSQGKPLLGNLDLSGFSFNKTESNILSYTYKKITIKDNDLTVAIADNADKRKVGLSSYTTLPENEGMLFVLNAKTNTAKAFWMKEMKIAIDIIWINEGKIVQVDKNAIPEPGVADDNLKKYIYTGAVDYVVEVNSGWTTQNNIKVGDNVKI